MNTASASGNDDQVEDRADQDKRDDRDRQRAETAEVLAKLSRLVPEPQEAHGLVMLMGSGVAQGLAGVRARQASLELARASARGSASLEARRTEAEAARVAEAVTRAQTRRLRLTEPRSDERTVGVYGYVVDGEAPVAAQVALVSGDKALACIDTDKAGSFALSVTSEEPLALRVMVADKVVHLDDEATLHPGPVATYRLVDLAQSTAPPSEEYVCDQGPAAPRQPLPDKGLTLGETMTKLREADATVAAVRVVAANVSTPRVAEIHDDDGAVTLHVEGRGTDKGRLAVAATVLAHQPDADQAGIGSAAAAATLLEAANVTTWADLRSAAALHPAALAKKFGVDRSRGPALSASLRATVSAIDFVEEG